MGLKKHVFLHFPGFGGLRKIEVDEEDEKSVISTLKLSRWPTNIVFSPLKEYPISLNCYADIYL